MRKRWIGMMAAAALLTLLAGAALADDDDAATQGTLRLSEGSVAAGIGWNWGHGTLTYHGQTYKVKVEGLSVGEVGITRAEASGTVHHLKSIDDFDGVYAAGSAGATAGEGKGITGLVNPKGVTIDLKSDTKGANLKVAAQGISLRIEK